MAELKVSNVSKSFDGVKILEDISIELHDQELVSLLGVSGGGKTTLFNVISGLEKPETGHVYLDGREITGCPGNVSYMLQKDMLLPYRTIEDNVKETAASAKNVASKLKEKVEKTVEETVNKVKEHTDDILDDLDDEDIFEDDDMDLDDIKEDVKEAAKDVKEDLEDAAGTAKECAAETAENVKEAVEKSVEQVSEDLKARMENAKKAMENTTAESSDKTE